MLFLLEPCIDYNGTRIENGEYQPGSDPCTTCQCVRGRKEVCMSVGCIPPDCPRPEPVPGVCCKYVCREPEMIHVEENSEAGTKPHFALYYCIKAVSHIINNRALTGKRPCINKAIHALLMQGYTTFNMFVPGPQICCRYEMCTARP